MLIPPSLSTLDDDEHLRAPTSPAAVSGETWESRPAFARRGSVPRAWVEGLARIDPARPPGDVPAKRWQTFIVDIGRFFDSGWGEKAAALGWEPIDLFGCDRDRPFARIDSAGLLWLLEWQPTGCAVREHGDDRDVHRGAAELAQAERARPRAGVGAHPATTPPATDGEIAPDSGRSDAYG